MTEDEQEHRKTMSTQQNVISTADDPQAALAMAAKVLNEVEQGSEEEVDITSPGDGFVDLPGGYLDLDGALHTTAEVRELTGSDEEHLSKITSTGRSVLAILDRAVMRVGSHQKVTPAMLDQMLTGDWEAMLLAIRRATFGNDVEYRLSCPACGQRSEISIDLSSVPVRSLDGPEDRVFTVETRKHTYLVSLPMGSTHREILGGREDRTEAEIATLILRDCISEIDGRPSLGISEARRMGLGDREAVLKEIASRAPGPRLLEATAECPSCGEEAAAPLSIAALFRL